MKLKNRLKNRLKCEHEMLPIGDFEPHPRNPNRHQDEGIEAIQGALKATGWRKPVVRSRRSGLCTKGHGRHRAALLLGETHYPCQWQDYDSDQAELEDLLADNQIGNETQTVATKQQALLAELTKQNLYTGHRAEEAARALAGLLEKARPHDTAPQAPREGFETVRLHFTPQEHHRVIVWLSRQGTGAQPERFLNGLASLTPQIKP